MYRPSPHAQDLRFPRQIAYHWKPADAHESGHFRHIRPIEVTVFREPVFWAIGEGKFRAQ
jgi:hypothetical protein